MNWMRELARRSAYLWRRTRFDRELDGEIEFHIQMRAEELEKAGMPHTDAVRLARREFGSSLRMRESARAAWQIHWLEDLLSDLRYGLRALRRNPGFAAAAIFSLALGTQKPVPVSRRTGFANRAVTAPRFSSYLVVKPATVPD